MCFENEPTTQCFLVFCLLPRGKVHSPADCPRDTSRIRSRIVFLFLNLRIYAFYVITYCHCDFGVQRYAVLSEYRRKFDFFKIFDRLRRFSFYSTGNDLNALTLCASRTTPLKARREPMFEFVFDASLFAFAYATPPFVFESL